MSFYCVNATLLNVRSTPAIQPTNIVGTLSHGERAERIGDSGTDWLKVRTEALEGFVAAKYLDLADGGGLPLPDTAVVPPEVHFPSHPSSKLASNEMRHCPLGELTVHPRQPGQALENRAAELHKIAADLMVTKSRRYAPDKYTYCNIYAYDFLYLSGVYLPRVWWTSKALVAMAGGQALGVVYDKTVREMTANELHDWLGEWGGKYGWTRLASADALQSRVNSGGIGAVTAQRVDLGTPGHITVVVPETAERRALRAGGAVIAPLQCQAGRINREFFGTAWWESKSLYRAFGFWAHD